MPLPSIDSVRFDSVDQAQTDTNGKVVRRWDVGELSRAERTPDGFLRTQGRITKAGIFEYIQPDGKRRREFRPPEEVFSAKALKSFRAAPLTNGHPPEMLTPKTIKRF